MFFSDTPSQVAWPCISCIGQLTLAYARLVHCCVWCIVVMLGSGGLRNEVIECSACLMAKGGPTTLLFVEQTNVGRGATNPTYSCVQQEQRVLGYVVTLISLW